MPDQPKGVPDGWAVVPSGEADAPSAGTWEDRGIGGKVWHPATGAKEGDRVDNQVLGVPPELAAVSALGVARAAAAPGLSLVARGVAGAKAAAGQAAPVIKYELVKSGLERMGVPSPLAMAGAMAVTGYKRGAKVPAAAAPVAAEAAPVAAEAASAPVGAPTPPPAQPVATAPAASPAPAGPAAEAAPLTPSKIANQVWTAARDAKAQLTADQNVVAFQGIKSGLSPQEAVAAAVRPAPAAAAASGAPVAAVPKLTAAEVLQAQKWMKEGVPYQQILDRIQQSRTLTGSLGTPTPEEAASAMRTLKATKYKQ